MKLLEDAIKENINGASSLKWGFDPDLNKRVNMVYLPEPVIDLILQWWDEAYGKPSKQQETSAAKINATLHRLNLPQVFDSDLLYHDKLVELLINFDQRLAKLEKHETLTLSLLKTITEQELLDKIHSAISNLEGGK